jgi:hypothetical protein
MKTTRPAGACSQAISHSPELSVALACKQAPAPDRP